MASVDLQRDLPGQMFSVGPWVWQVLPIWNRNQGTAGAGFCGRALQAEQRLLALRIDNEVTLSRRKLLLLRDTVVNYQRDILPPAEQNVELLRRGWQAGKFDLFRVITASRELAEAHIHFLSLQRDLWDAAIEAGACGRNSFVDRRSVAISRFRRAARERHCFSLGLWPRQWRSCLSNTERALRRPLPKGVRFCEFRRIRRPHRASPGVQKRNPIQLVTVGKTKLARDVEVVGSVSYDGNQFARVGPLIAGRIASVRVGLGDKSAGGASARRTGQCRSGTSSRCVSDRAGSRCSRAGQPSP